MYTVYAFIIGVVVGLLLSWMISFFRKKRKNSPYNLQKNQINQTRDEFLSIASHQLRTPLTSINGYISMLLDGDAGELNDLQKRFLREAFESGNRMARIIANFLNLSRLQSGKFEIQKQRDNFSRIINEEISRLALIAQTRSIKINSDIEDGIIIDGDFSKLRQVVMNLVDNAIFYSSDSSVIDVQLKKQDSLVIFTVKDNGIGVPKNQQAKLFTKFYRADNAKKRRPDGTGVGLFLARQVVEGHDGEIIFSSEEGEGSLFGFSLPIDKK